MALNADLSTWKMMCAFVEATSETLVLITMRVYLMPAKIQTLPALVMECGTRNPQTSVVFWYAMSKMSGGS